MKSYTFSTKVMFIVFLFLSRVESGVLEKSYAGIMEIAFVHSYEIDYPGSNDEDVGVVRGLIQKGWFENINLVIHRFYMNTKTENTTPEKKLSVANEVMISLSKTNISAICAFDENAILYVGMEENKKFPVVFVGMNGQPEYYNEKYNFMNTRYLPGKNTTGVYEKIFVAESLRLFSQIFPDMIGGTVIGLFDNTTTGNLVKSQVEAELNSTTFDLGSLNISFPLRTVSSMSEYQDIILNEVNVNKDIKAIYYAVLSLEIDHDKPNLGNYGVVDIIKWTILNNLKPEMSIGPPFSIYGLFGGSGNDYKNMGEHAGEMLGDILNEKFEVGEIPLEFDPRYGIYFNVDRIQQLRPYVIMIDEDEMNFLLGVADYVYYGQTALYEDPSDSNDEKENPQSYWWLSLIFSLVFIIFILILFFCVFFTVILFFFLVLFLCCCFCITISTSTLFKLKIKQKKFDRIKDIDQVLIEQEMRRGIGGSLDGSSNRFQSSIDSELFRIPYKDLTLKKVIGKGGSSTTVFDARWKNKKVAYKSFPAQIYSSADSEYFEEFEKELLFLSSLHHPNILDFYGFIGEEGRLGFVTELAEQGDLQNFILDQKLLENSIPQNLMLSILLGIILGMEYLHDRKVTHRDLKCQNILLSDDNEAKIIDFGLSKQLSKSKNMTRRIGTSMYMAPEVIRGEMYDEKIDVFSFSIVMYVLLTEEPNKVYSQFGSGIGEQFGIEMKIANDSSFRPIVPPKEKIKERNLSWFVSLMQKCWNDDSSKRPTFKMIKKVYEKANNIV